MANWRRVTHSTFDEVYLNLDLAASIIWDETAQHSIVNFPGGNPEIFNISETPETVLREESLA